MDRPKTGVERIEQYIAGAPVSYHRALRRSYAKIGGRTNAIRAKCLSCCNWQRVEVAECTVWTCPLHPWRPYQSFDASDDEFDEDLGK